MPIETNFDLLEDIAKRIFDSNPLPLAVLGAQHMVRNLCLTAGALEEYAEPNYDVFEIDSVTAALDILFIQLVEESAAILSIYTGKTPLQVVLDRIELTKVKNANYGGSWAKRGGPGAFFGYVRKIDRIESLVGKHGLDVFKTDSAVDLQDESILDTFEDVIGYSMLILERRLQGYIGSKVTPITPIFTRLLEELE